MNHNSGNNIIITYSFFIHLINNVYFLTTRMFSSNVSYKNISCVMSWLIIIPNSKSSYSSKTRVPHYYPLRL